MASQLERAKDVTKLHCGIMTSPTIYVQTSPRAGTTMVSHMESSDHGLLRRTVRLSPTHPLVHHRRTQMSCKCHANVHINSLSGSPGLTTNQIQCRPTNQFPTSNRLIRRHATYSAHTACKLNSSPRGNTAPIQRVGSTCT